MPPKRKDLEDLYAEATMTLRAANQRRPPKHHTPPDNNRKKKKQRPARSVTPPPHAQADPPPPPQPRRSPRSKAPPPPDPEIEAENPPPDPEIEEENPPPPPLTTHPPPPPSKVNRPPPPSKTKARKQTHTTHPPPPPLNNLSSNPPSNNPPRYTAASQLSTHSGPPDHIPQPTPAPTPPPLTANSNPPPPPPLTTNSNPPPPPTLAAQNPQSTNINSPAMSTTERVPRSIRVSDETDEEEDDEFGLRKQKRGTVNGTTLARMLARNGNKQLVLAKSYRYLCPASAWQRSLLVHQIGSIVREKVPMLASSYKKVCKLDPEYEYIVFDALSTQFDVPPGDNWLRDYINIKITSRFKDWKCDCHAHYKEYKEENEIPLEFVHRPEQWEWLKTHFEDPKFKAMCARNKKARLSDNRMNHHGGKRLIIDRAEDYMKKGDMAPLISAFQDIYANDPMGAMVAEKMREDVNVIVAEADPSGVLDPLDDQEQLHIITKNLGTKPGIHISGVGQTITREPRPRGRPAGSQSAAHLAEELNKVKEDFQKTTATLLERIKMLEEMHAGPATTRPSDGASFVPPI